MLGAKIFFGYAVSARNEAHSSNLELCLQFTLIVCCKGDRFHCLAIPLNRATWSAVRSITEWHRLSRLNKSVFYESQLCLAYGRGMLWLPVLTKRTHTFAEERVRTRERIQRCICYKLYSACMHY